VYGLVNKAFRKLLVDDHGEQTWHVVRNKAGVDDETFVGMRQYPDAVTYDLIGAASEHLQIPFDDMLVAFGEYWMVHWAQEGYGELLDMCGSTLVEFLDGLDDMHTRLGLSFPLLRPPSFRCTRRDDRCFELRYRSHRPGLAPFVVGLINGLGVRLNTEVEVEYVHVRDDGADFLIHHRPQKSDS
jgi:hypothetical protein